MPTTVVSPLVYSEDEYNLAALLSPSAVQKVGVIQEQLQKLLGDAIWLTPTNCLHITLMEVICDTEYKDFSRAQYFNEWYEKYNEQVRRTIAGLSPYDATFNEIRISQGAIIIKAPDPKPFNDIRDKLLSEIELPQGTKIPPNIAHCTIARFNKVVDLDDMQLKARELTIDLTERIAAFSLVKDLVPPDFSPKIVEKYELSDTTTHIVPPNQ